MTAEAAALSRSWKVGRWTCTMTVARPRPGALVHSVVEWSPNVPRRLKPKELESYRAGRNAAIAELARSIGGTIAVMEI